MTILTDKERLDRTFLNNRKLAIVSVTNNCNLKCIYCRPDIKSNWYDRLSDKKKDIKPITANFITQILGDEVVEILLTGGEPFAAKNIIELICDLSRNGRYLSIHTNGVHKKAKEVIKHIYEQNIRPNIHVSSELFHKHQIQLRKSKLPDEFIAYASKELGLKIELKVIIHSLLNECVGDIESCLDFWIQKGVTQFRFQPLVQTGDVPTRLILTDNDVNVINKLIEIKSGNYSNYIRNSIESFNNVRSVMVSKDGYIKKKCDMNKKIIFVTQDGVVKSCAHLWGRDAKDCWKKYDFLCCGFN